MNWKLKKVGTVPTFLLLIVLLSSCSPFYIIRAGWEETKILAKRKPISKLIESGSTEETLKEKLSLVLEARSFAARLGLKPEGSFTKYSDVGQEELLWVLSGSKKTTFSPITWWFPIVGRIPYKGFFEKDDAVASAKKLKEQNLDIYLRPSAAFSTLGWFDDPLLSTVIKFDEVSLADVVIHELVHNTFWVKGNAFFNETAANFIGAKGAQAFFTKSTFKDSDKQVLARARVADQKRYAAFIAAAKKELTELYKEGVDKKLEEQEILQRREDVIQQIKESWLVEREKFKAGYHNSKLPLNNAFLIAQEIYHHRLEDFHKYFEKVSQGDLKSFITDMTKLAKKSNEENKDPYGILSSWLKK